MSLRNFGVDFNAYRAYKGSGISRLVEVSNPAA